MDRPKCTKPKLEKFNIAEMCSQKLRTPNIKNNLIIFLCTAMGQYVRGHVYNLMNRIAYKYFIYCGRHAIYLSGGMLVLLPLLLMCVLLFYIYDSQSGKTHTRTGGRKQMRHRTQCKEFSPHCVSSTRIFIVNENHKRNTKGHFGYGTHTQFGG